MAKQVQHSWINEAEAAQIIGFAPRTIRRYAKDRKLPINWTSVNGKAYKYSKEDIDRMLLANSSVLPTK